MASKNGIDMIKREHKQLRTLFAKCEKAMEAKDLAEVKLCIRELFPRMCKHSSAEEQYLYPLFRKKLPNGDLHYLRDKMDDQINKEIINTLEQMDAAKDPELYFETVRKLRQMEEGHLEIEEKELDMLQPLLSQAQLEKLEDDLTAAEAFAPTHPHPDLPTSTILTKILHPIVGAVDRLTGALAGASINSHSMHTEPQLTDTIITSDEPKPTVTKKEIVTSEHETSIAFPDIDKTPPTTYPPIP
jgi:hemerythrin superfamily protein